MDAARREKVVHLCRDGTDRKLLKGSPVAALRPLSQARELAVQEPRLHSPWPELTAYRLAHVLMRQEDPNLVQAERLFAESATLESLGPLPKIYHAATLHRRGRPEELILRALDQAREACELDRVHRTSRAGWAGIQEQSHNLLELAVYFTGAPYRLQGRGGVELWRDLFPDFKSCVLVGPSQSLAAVHYPEELARRELEEIAKTEPDAAYFEFLPHRSICSWRRGDEECWLSASEQNLHLLALLLSGRYTHVNQLHLLMELDAENFRQAKKRLGDALKALRPGLAYMKARPGEVPILANKRIYGVVPSSLLR